MRLWHYKLIPFLPRPQLLSQWRELNSIFVKQDKHILINYIYEYNWRHLLKYTHLILDEMEKRNIKVKSLQNLNNYILECDEHDMYLEQVNIPFANHHNNRYLLQCFYNLQEKYDRCQKGFSKNEYNKLVKFMNEELAWSEIDFYEDYIR